ncbi:hypothetical protein DICPUDRAFT_77297 [Dictyostelium purpureum]|uniref:Lipoprotein n=1 Tax=Dictyostelium purpureum TaxID=5786 RepID=F0ZG73_DICPU|nr:uncharacterized protein DICPUDRAFT_77297 [Dictyostelium purpureum]EGC37070.1 hypothetical protein DICPUDRAFT_77297 [Dictyostelium purpureum]|eukprot:XP_003286427.1 hypothetical protein DICPUDRAFT_77297 [Dictyostelium purpureum]
MLIIKKLVLLIVLISFVSCIHSANTTPEKCLNSLQRYFVEGENVGIEITYVDPSGNVVYMRGNSKTGYMFSQDLANVDSYAGLSSQNQDCFDGKTQPFSAKRTVQGFYDSRSFRISKAGVATVNNEATLRTFQLTDCNDQGNVYSGYTDTGRLYTFHLTSGKKYDLVALQC